MEFLKLFYFLSVGLYIFQYSFFRNFKFQWIIILTSVFIHAFYFFGINGIIFLLFAGLVATIAELVSLKSRYKVFGVGYKYNFSNRFFASKIIIAGVYPLDVTGAWMLLKYLSFFLVGFIFSGSEISPIAKALITSFALVSFDFLIDPIAIRIKAWEWDKSGRFFGIPWQNFSGWFIVGFIISIVFYSLTPIRSYDLVMVIPVLVVWATFPWILGRRLVKIDKLMGILANIPIITFLILGIVKLLM